MGVFATPAGQMPQHILTALPYPLSLVRACVPGGVFAASEQATALRLDIA